MFNKFYPLARGAMFCLDAEKAHDLSIKTFSKMSRAQSAALFGDKLPEKPVEVMGLTFRHPVGLAAGLDKNGACVSAFDGMGFAGIEVGTVTPLAQAGNDKPRLFRLPEHQAIINRMGFNNHGVDRLVGNVQGAERRGVLGINIGKNKLTDNDKALDDYLICMDKVYQYADYITINISSPNTPGLRGLQHGDALHSLLAGIKAKQAALADQYGAYKPVAVKVAPDLDAAELDELSAAFVKHKIDGLIATNTTLERKAVAGHRFAEEAGGLSGAPVAAISTEVVAEFVKRLDGALPVIGVGGIACADDAIAKRQAGAAMVQIYSGFIYRGPSLIQEIVRAW